MSDPQIFNVVLGTAGHIDHGKSTLVTALTGINPDRLKEEQERGITIDLGFAPLELKNGLRVGIIDVPGHERFIKNMVAGATGIDFVMLIIAADDGVMAQTREHLQIIQLLDVPDGLTVITKRDLVDAEMLELVKADVEELLPGTCLEGKPIIPVSSKTGAGLDELRLTLEKALSKLKRRTNAGPFRMPIQRVFAKEGFGTVVTGVPISGQVAIGDTIDILPPGYSGRVKGLHAYKHVITRGQAGHSTAVNLIGPNIDKKEVARGMVAVSPGIFQPSKLLTAELRHLKGMPWPLRHRAPVRFHSGTAEIQGKVLLLDGEHLPAGQNSWVQILLEEPTLVVPGDRYILRHQSPMLTLGGGRIVDTAPVKRKRQNEAVLAELQARAKVLDKPQELLALIVAASQTPKTAQELCGEVGLLPEQLQKLLEPLLKSDKVVVLKAGAVFASPQWLKDVTAAIVSATNAYLKEHPALGGIDLPNLRARLEKTDTIGAGAVTHFDDLLALLKSKGLIKAEANVLSLPGRERKLEGALAKTAEQVEQAFLKGEFTPPTVPEVEAQLKIQTKQLREILKFLQDTGKLVQATPEICFHTAPLEKARGEVVKLFAAKPELTASEVRQALGMNRKFVIPLLELFDKQGLTQRVGDMRRLVKK